MNIHPLISQTQIADAVSELGARITEDFQERNLTVLSILTGSIVFVTDLMRRIAIPHQLGLVQASSYRGTTTSPAELRLNLDWLPELRGRDLLLVDDIFDTGKTLSTIRSRLEEFEPASIHSAVLLWKKSRTVVDMNPDYFCFEIPDEFVVGYGLDFNNHYRHLPYIGIVSDE